MFNQWCANATLIRIRRGWLSLKRRRFEGEYSNHYKNDVVCTRSFFTISIRPLSAPSSFPATLYFSSLPKILHHPPCLPNLPLQFKEAKQVISLPPCYYYNCLFIYLFISNFFPLFGFQENRKVNKRKIRQLD